MSKSEKSPKIKMSKGFKIFVWIVCLLAVIPCIGLISLFFVEPVTVHVNTTGIYRWTESYRSATVVGFTDDAVFPARLEIPQYFELDGEKREVTYLTGERYGCGGGQPQYGVTSEQIFIPYGMSSIDARFVTSADIFVPNFSYGFYNGKLHAETEAFLSSPARCFVSYDQFKDMSRDQFNRLNGDYMYCFPANVTYRFGKNFTNRNGGIYFIDNLDESGRLSEPPVPYINQYHRFEGWYLDENYERAWDFDTDILTVEPDSNGKPIYSETNLYAKWRVDLSAGAV